MSTADYVMGFVDGRIVFDHQDGHAYPEELRAKLAESLVDTLVDLHALDPASVGLGDLGKTEDYCARQLRRWKRQIDEDPIAISRSTTCARLGQHPRPTGCRHRARRLSPRQLRSGRRHDRCGARLGTLHLGRCARRPRRHGDVVGR